VSSCNIKRTKWSWAVGATIWKQLDGINAAIGAKKVHFYAQGQHIIGDLQPCLKT
jgi:hypothetical protein